MCKFRWFLEDETCSLIRFLRIISSLSVFCWGSNPSSFLILSFFPESLRTKSDPLEVWWSGFDWRVFVEVSPCVFLRKLRNFIWNQFLNPSILGGSCLCYNHWSILGFVQTWSQQMPKIRTGYINDFINSDLINSLNGVLIWILIYRWW